MATWDCGACGTYGVSDEGERCPNCGAPRADMAPTLPAVEAGTARFVLQADKGGADWFCEYCNAGNAIASEECSGCGAPKGENARSEPAPVGRVVPPATPTSAPRANAPRANPTLGPEAGKAVAKAIGGVTLFVGGVFAILVLGFCCLFMFMFAQANKQNHRVATVKSFAWTRTITLQELKPEKREGWTLPSNAKLLSEERRVQYEKEVFSHTETRTRKRQVREGNNWVMREEPYEYRVMRKEPVYATWYTWEFMNWQDIEPAVARGADQDPKWPELKLAENQQAGMRDFTYTVTVRFDDNGSTEGCEVSEADFLGCEVGQKVLVTTNVLGKVKSLRPFQVERSN